MKRVLFLSFAYPYGHFGPSDNCTARIMNALVQTGEFEVFNISCKPENAESAPNYKIIDGVNLILLPFKENLKKHSRFQNRMMALIRMPVYPFNNLLRIYKYYRACRILLKGKQFDLVVSQCFPQESVFAGALLRKNGYINNVMVLFWDNIYGKIPHRLVPEKFAFRRQRCVEEWVSHYSDRLVSPFPVKAFHDKYGDVDAAVGKRFYLEHPSLTRPSVNTGHNNDGYIVPGKINIIYSGRVYNRDNVSFIIRLLNVTKYADRLNVVFFSRGISKPDIDVLCKGFKGAIRFLDWIPLDQLFALYPYVDYFLSFTGNPAQITSKVYEYMSFGKPIIHIYQNDEDINVPAFSRYPFFHPIDVRHSLDIEKYSLECFLDLSFGKHVVFEEVENLFPTATASAYVKLIANMISS